MSKRSGSNTRRLARTVTVRWDDPSYSRLRELAQANGKSVGQMIRWLSDKAHLNLPRTQELSRELIHLRSAVNGLAVACDQGVPGVAEELRSVMLEIERSIRRLR